jgi:galactokinase
VLSEVVAELIDRLGEPVARVVRAPARVNIIGEHVDYLGHRVLPFACNLDVVLASVPLRGRVVLQSMQEPGVVELAVDGPRPPISGWGRYVAGVVDALLEAGLSPHGFRGVLSSRIPVGAGLSSSAALEAAVALTLLEGEKPTPQVLQRAEQLAVGVPCGVMDQVAVLHGRAGHALLLDCASVTWSHVAVPRGLAFVVVDTGTRRALDDGRYALRRSEAEAAVAGGPDSNGIVERRRRHVVTEAERVDAVAAAMSAGDLDAVGVALDASHRSLRDDFEVSSEALDLAVSEVRGLDGCLGSRLVGAGFAGCVLAAVRSGAEDSVAAGAVRLLGDRLHGVRAFPVSAVDGAGSI